MASNTITRNDLMAILDKIFQKPTTKGFWTPKIYDLDTAKGSFATDSGRYYDIAGGAIRIFYFNQQASASFSFSTMLQIRGDAMSGYTIMGGTVYAGSATNSLGDKTIQAVSGAVYVRPNFTGTINAGWWSGFFVGVRNDYL